MTYNILEYPNAWQYGDTTYRNPYFRTVISAVNPDIIAAQEIESATEADGFLTNVLNTFGETYLMATFVANGSDNNVLYYKQSKFAFISASLVNSLGHPTLKFKIYNVNTKDTITIFNTHFSSSSQNQRNTAALDVRSETLTFSQDEYFIDIGDHNLSGGTESAFVTLLSNTTSGYFLDPQNLQDSSVRGQFIPQ